MRPAPTPTVLEPLPTTPVSAALILFLLAAPIQILTYSLSLLTGARYAWWFPDLPYLLLGVALITLTLGGSMQFALFLAKRLRRSQDYQRPGTRPYGFSGLGWWPFWLLGVLAVLVLYTSNIALLGLQLHRLGHGPYDALLYALETGLFEYVLAWAPRPVFWEFFYSLAWSLFIGGYLLSVVVTRSLPLATRHLASYLFFYQLGRYADLVFPVRGPAFHRPEAFLHLRGSLTEQTMQWISEQLFGTLTPQVSGVLVGGISAMPSLHMGMLALFTLWLARLSRKTLYVTVPLLGLVWTSTILLGWHYLLDGVIGIPLALGCERISSALVGKMEPWFSRTRRSR